MVVRLGGRAGGMPRWSDMCPADSIVTAVLVPKKYSRRENPAPASERKATCDGDWAAGSEASKEVRMERAARRARGVRRGAGWARRVLACDAAEQRLLSVDHLSHFQGSFPPLLGGHVSQSGPQ